MLTSMAGNVMRARPPPKMAPGPMRPPVCAAAADPATVSSWPGWRRPDGIRRCTSGAPAIDTAPTTNSPCQCNGSSQCPSSAVTMAPTAKLLSTNDTARPRKRGAQWSAISAAHGPHTPPMASPVTKRSTIHGSQPLMKYAPPMPIPSQHSASTSAKRRPRFSEISPNRMLPSIAPSMVAVPSSPPSGRVSASAFNMTGMTMASTVRSKLLKKYERKAAHNTFQRCGLPLGALDGGMWLGWAALPPGVWLAKAVSVQ